MAEAPQALGRRRVLWEVPAVRAELGPGELA